MYDGIKIECAVPEPRKWDNSLCSVGRFDETTGEIIPFSEAKANSLTFIKTPSNKGRKYIIHGSLHRFARNGGENNDDFTIVEVANTIREIQNKFGIDPEKSTVQNLEFGVNIILPEGITAGEFQKYLVSAYTKAFEKLNPKRPAIGYIAEYDEFSVKIYDKGFQSESGETQQLRVEIRVNRVRWLEQFGVIKPGQPLYLSDLLKRNIIKILGEILQKKVRALICVPRNLDVKKLTLKERLTFAECKDARSWEDWTSKQRSRKKAQLERIFEKLDQPNPVDALERLVSEKWHELSRFKIPDLSEQEPKTPEKRDNIQLIVVGIRSLFEMIITSHFAIIRWLFAKGESRNTSLMLIHAPRGNPLMLSPPEILLIGFRRWIDLCIRSPDKLLFVS